MAAGGQDRTERTIGGLLKRKHAHRNVLHRGTGLSYFFYDDGSRSEKVILKELDGYKGIIQSDGLGAYKKVAMLSGGKITRVACLQHCKRAFLEDEVKDNPDATKVAALANSLYHNEHQHRIGEDGWTVDDNLKWNGRHVSRIQTRSIPEPPPRQMD